MTTPLPGPTTVRALELFCGIGGFAAAVAGLSAGPPDGPGGAPARVAVVGAYDLSPHVLEIYRHNYPDHFARQANLEFYDAARLAAHEASMWWMSPPCQPYTTRGLRRDLEDHRAASLLRMMRLLEEAGPDMPGPDMLGMENVPGFVGSQGHALVLETLERTGYAVRERVLCPTELGVPARRERYYLVASRRGLVDVPLSARPMVPLADFLDPTFDEALVVPDDVLATHGPGMRILDLQAEPAAIANTVTGAYGKTWQAAGSYLRLPDGRVRRFSPRELLRLLGFPESFDFPPETPLRHRYKAIGNSLSVVAMREVLRAFGFVAVSFAAISRQPSAIS